MARARWEVSEAESVAKKDKLALLQAQHAAGNKSNENRGRGAAIGAVDEVCEEGRRILRGGGGFCEVEEAGEEAEEVHIAPAGVAK